MQPSHAQQAPQPAAPAQPIRIERYDLPTDELASLAAHAGLEWVQSDAERIRTVQAAMAAEPAPARVPREPRAPLVVDEGPLVLVETKKDLSQMKLPFERLPSP
jgi:ribonuclease E